jgi:thymidylate kinase
MSYFIIIRGPAGVGKTTIANALAKTLHGFHISIDSILAQHGLDYVPGDSCVPEHKMLAANKIVVPVAQKKLAAGQIVIFDGNFYHKSQIEDLTAALGYPSFVFTLKADLETCLARNKARTVPLQEQGVKDVFELVSQFDYGVLVNTNNKTVEKVVREIITGLVGIKDAYRND